jgi:sulfotransferase
VKKYHFIAGLPRSGSTLLSSLFNQNPRFTASISDGVLGYIKSIIIGTDVGSGIKSLVSPEKQKKLIKGIFDNYYYDGNEVCFNTNRSWGGSTSLIKDLYPESKIIFCIREIPWILDSFEKLHRSAPYDIKAIYGNADLPTVYHRTNYLMDLHLNPGAIVGLSALNTKEAFFSNEQSMICVVEYNKLTKDPINTLKKIYEFLDEPWFDHDINDVTANYDEYDSALNMKGLHTVKRKVEFTQRKPIIPQDLWERWQSESFWLNDFDHIKKKILWIGE